jgi:hypothetical protein
MRSLALVALMISGTALACPKLKGKYAACIPTTGHSTGSTDMVVTQKIFNDVMVYKVDATNSRTHERETEKYIADGKVRVQLIKDPSSNMKLEMLKTVTCVGKVLEIDIKMKLNGEYSGYSKVSVSKEKKKIIIASRHFDGQEEVSDREVCE